MSSERAIPHASPALTQGLDVAFARETSTIKVVCFDIGGVLVRHCRSWDEGVRAAGLGELVREITPRQRELQLQHATALVCGLGTVDDFTRGISDAFDGAFTKEQIGLIHEAWVSTEYDGVHDVISRLISTGRVETGVLSNIDESHLSRIGLPGPRGWPTPALLRHQVASCRIGLAKPMPGIYAHFEQISGCSAGEILFLDDLDENARAAQSRGWITHVIDWRTETAPQIESVLRRYNLL